MTPRRTLIAVAVGITGALGGPIGCAVGPNYKAPKPLLPEQFATPRANDALAPAAAPVDLAAWWHALNDPELNALVERAITANPDLQIALLRLQEARTYEVVVTGEALPDVVGSGAAARGTGSDLSRGRADGPLVSSDSSGGLQHINKLAGFDTVWELDVFGRVRREIEAAKDDAAAAAAARDAVLTTVVADVVRAYVDLRGFQTQAAVLRKNLDVIRDSLRVVRIRFERGITNELDVTLAARELATLEAQVAPVDAQVRAAQYTLAVLLGRYPDEVAQELAAPAMVPTVPGPIQPGAPVDLLRRRPDIRQAERELASATARIGVATANLFPRIALAGAIGYQAQGLGSPDVAQHIWSLGPGAVWPLLDFGALDAQVDIADLRARERLVAYKRTIQQAVKDVDTALDAYEAQQQREAHLGEALTASERAVTLANERYERGLTDFLNVVDAERQEYEIQVQYASAQVGSADQFVTLYKSLGGGWEGYQSMPAVRRPQPAIVAAFRRVLMPDDRATSDADQD